MNKHPDTSGIERRWKDEDARRKLARALLMDPDNLTSRRSVDGMMSSLEDVIRSHRRSLFVGFGVFEWRKWKNRTPTGKRVEVWRLTFKPARNMKERKWKK